MKELSIEEKRNYVFKSISRIGEIIVQYLDSMNKDNERLRKTTIAFLKDFADKGYENAVECIDWLEKQGEQKVSYTTIVETGDGGINALVTRELPIDGCDGKQEPTDKVEPKFKVGDWIVENGVNRNPVQIESFEEDKGVGIKVWFSNGTGTYIDFLKGYHLWTIQDAKDGDVLAYGQVVFIFKKIHCVCLRCYCSSHNDGSFTAYSYDLLTDKYFGGVYPATKEQHDLLFQKMKEEGYAWNEETLELKKIDIVR